MFLSEDAIASCPIRSKPTCPLVDDKQTKYIGQWKQILTRFDIKLAMKIKQSKMKQQRNVFQPDESDQVLAYIIAVSSLGS